jgi:hypothetical protein
VCRTLASGREAKSKIARIERRPLWPTLNHALFLNGGLFLIGYCDFGQLVLSQLIIQITELFLLQKI